MRVKELARLVCERIPCADRIRFCSAGSEATLHLIRACRGFTGREKIIRVEGHFHGYHELIENADVGAVALEKIVSGLETLR